MCEILQKYIVKKLRNSSVLTVMLLSEESFNGIKVYVNVRQYRCICRLTTLTLRSVSGQVNAGGGIGTY